MPQPMPLTTEKGIVKCKYFRGSTIQIEVKVKGQILRGFRILDKKQINEGDAVFVFIHKKFTDLTETKQKL